MKDDLISRSALLEKAIGVVVYDEGGWDCNVRAVPDDVIEKAPAVDAVEVVRCKDCKHWMKDVPGCTDFVGRCELANYMVGATGHCVYGERRDGDAD